MRKIEIKIVKPQLGLAESSIKKVDRRVAVDLVEREIAEFVNEDDKAEIESRKAKNAEKYNAILKSNENKAKARTSVDDERAKQIEEQEKKKREQQLKMQLGKRKSILSDFADFVDLKSDEFKLELETTKEQFNAMVDKAKQAKSDHEAELVNAANKVGSKESTVEKVEKPTAKKTGAPKGSKGSKK